MLNKKEKCCDKCKVLGKPFYDFCDCEYNYFLCCENYYSNKAMKNYELKCLESDIQRNENLLNDLYESQIISKDYDNIEYDLLINKQLKKIYTLMEKYFILNKKEIYFK